MSIADLVRLAGAGRWWHSGCHVADERRRERARGESTSLTVELTATARGAAADAAWRLIRMAADFTPGLAAGGRAGVFADGAHAPLAPVTSDHPAPVLAWAPDSGWRSLLPGDDPRSGLLSLYLPVCSATTTRPITVGHLGQSLDGFIATHRGDSQFVTGDDNLLHMHRMRALCDAVVVGAGTVAADDPQLTTRRVPGPNPVRVIVDPDRRLAPTARVFVDRAAPTLYCCGRSRLAPNETHVAAAAVVPIDDGDGDRAASAQVLARLHARGCTRVFVEGGGVTVSAFLEENLLDRLHIAIAPVLIGDGRPAIRLAPTDRLRDCRRPAYRVFKMGGDVLFDCDLRVDGPAGPDPLGPSIARVI